MAQRIAGAAKRGRPVKGAELVNDIGGSHAARERLRIILQTLAGTMSIQEASSVLGIKRSGFHKLRRQFLAQATGLLEPRPRGRQRREPTEAELELAKLRQELIQTKLDLKAQQIREEIALVMPHLLQAKRGTARKKTSRHTTRGGSWRSGR
jgi:hypothetical protein